MKQLTIIGIFTLIFNPKGITQTCNTSSIVELSQSIKESSGLIYFDGKLVTHNDSGDGPNLYEIDTTTGSVIRTVTIANATNIDWEDITQDSNYIYIGDIGNNSGTRSDLVIYKIAKIDFNMQTTVFADKIHFQYADQTDFTPHPNNTNYDCEAMICIGDSLILFSKNWINHKTYTYLLPKTAGYYSINIRDSLNTQGTVSGATYNANIHSILLVGYDGATPFIWELSQFNGYDVLGGTNTRCNLTTTGSMQIEAITTKGNSEYFLSSEELIYGNYTFAPYLSTFINGNTSIIDEYGKNHFNIFPNPVNKYLTITANNTSIHTKQQIRITNILGNILFEATNDLSLGYQIETYSLPNGIYYISIINDDNIITQSFIKN